MIDADGGVMFLTEEDYLDYFDERDTGGQDDETEEDVETE